MTLITHGLAEELREYKIGCNTLWPRTTIETAAVKNLLGGDQAIGLARTTDIMSDSAYVILTSDSSKTTDQFFYDDVVMGSVGVYDLSKYRVNKEVQDWQLIPDFAAGT